MGRDWGPLEGEKEDGVPWIGIHGWLDNAGTFEPLLPHLPKGRRIICVDLPGHGLSSHLPEGQNYNMQLESLSYIQRIRRFLGLEEFWILGHSMGAGIGALYAATFPEEVKGLIMLDLIKLVSRKPHEVVDLTRQAVTENLAMEEKSKTRSAKVYESFDAALSRVSATEDLSSLVIFVWHKDIFMLFPQNFSWLSH